MSYTPPRETLYTDVSRPNPKALAACVVLAQPRAAFHPCTCGLCGDATALIDYDNRGGCYWETCEPKTIVINYFLYTDA
jgi:hypothetical protein